MSSIQTMTINALKAKNGGAILRNVQKCASVHCQTLTSRPENLLTSRTESYKENANPTSKMVNCHNNNMRTHTLANNFQNIRSSHGNRKSKRTDVPAQKKFSTRGPITPYRPQVPLGRRNIHNHDVRRFLQEVGTDSKETSYWLKYFQKVVEPYRPFAVIQVDQEIFSNNAMLEEFVSCLSFLHRNEMKCVLVHGISGEGNKNISPDEMATLRTRMLAESMVLASKLELHGTPTRPFFSGSNIVQAEAQERSSFQGRVAEVNAEPIKWSLCSGHMPIILGIGETKTGQLLNLDAANVTSEVSKAMQPFKVMYLNASGGVKDSQGQVIPEFNMPDHLDEKIGEDWCTTAMRKKLKNIYSLLTCLPAQTSVVITSAGTLLKELFTHHGSGTFFKKSDPLKCYYNYENVHSTQLVNLINESYGRELCDDYIDATDSQINRLIISNSYNAAAVITNQPGLDVPYLDKFAISERTRLEGTEEMLWGHIKDNYKKLFWRSRGDNKNNPWYFKKSQGSWSDGEWTVFWYGVSDTDVITDMIHHALSLPDSFTPNNGNNRNNPSTSNHYTPMYSNRTFQQVQAVYL